MKTLVKKEMDESTKQLISWIEKRNKIVAEFLIKAYRGEDTSPDMFEQTVAFFSANSSIAAAVLASPGSSIISELLYDQSYTDSVLDQYFYRSRGGRAVKGRLEAVQKYLPSVIKSKYLNGNSSNKEVTVGSLGSGPGRYMVDMILNLARDGYENCIKATCFDTDATAILRGKRNAEINGVSKGVMRFKRVDMQGKIASYHKSSFDILVLKGILCPFENAGCRTLLEHVKDMVKPGGIVIASNVSEKFGREDQFVRFIMDIVLNWRMVYKTEKDMQSIFEDAGMKWLGSFTDSLGYHIMGVGEVG